MLTTRKRHIDNEHPDSSPLKVVRVASPFTDARSSSASPTSPTNPEDEAPPSYSRQSSTGGLVLDAPPNAQQNSEPLSFNLTVTPRVKPTAVSNTKSYLRTPSESGKKPGARDVFLRAFKKAKKSLYKFSPIKEDEVRLLVIKEGTGKDEINATLLTVKDHELGTKHQYEALSYHWGEGDDNKPIIIQDDIRSMPMKSLMDAVDGMMSESGMKARRLYVKPNLYKALKCLRKNRGYTPLWVDALCINQPNEAEKVIQVNKMDKIYRNAQNVCIWLGGDDEDSNRAMAFIPDILNQDNHHSLLEDAKYIPKWTSLFELLKWSWFSRRWIIQELALAQAATVHCGTLVVHWSDFKDAIGIFYRYFEYLKPKLNLEPESLTEFELKPLGANLLVELTTNLFRKRPDKSYESTKGLETLVSLLSGFDTSDPRDTIHALRNISREMNHTSRSSIEQPPRPDYGRDLFQVYRDFVAWVVKDSKSLDIICRHWALPERKSPGPKTPHLVTLPSWIQIVDKSPFGRGEDVFRGRRAGDSFVGMPGKSHYRASGTKEPKVIFSTDDADRSSTQMKEVPHDMFMVAEGISLGTITFSTQPFPDGIVPQVCLEKLGWDFEDMAPHDHAPDYLWRTLVADRGPDGMEAPTYYHRACLYSLLNISRNGHINIRTLLQQSKSRGQRSIVEDYLARVLAVTWNRCFIEGKVESDRLVGLGAPGTQVGDIITVLYGCSVPTILRPIRNTATRSVAVEGYKLIGEAYIYGKMDGEAMFEGYNEQEFKII
ncbi:HET-domain-containing protein [Corynespora cassiicola Philippines]|uniref:HET-domain-containing protein n=1 Tax=Corynespora cassiicola Philippines TaxID=1448308 RepID=A0A2T2P2I1_CORCC|nr:HET-domain-containing protein [Corynespora cassiicola Philippines]